MSFKWDISCPSCSHPLGSLEQFQSNISCTKCNQNYQRIENIWRFLSPSRVDHYSGFLTNYNHVRRKEGRGSSDPRYYHDLPVVKKNDPFEWEWGIRAKTYKVFNERILNQRHKGLRILDLGAGVGWLSNRLYQAGHLPCTVDVNIDSRDGLGAARFYTPKWPLIQAEFDFLPFEPDQIDMVIYNASFHYSTDYNNTLKESLRVLKEEGIIVILDSPIYRKPESGGKMITERKASFKEKYGISSDALPSKEYLTYNMLKLFERDHFLKLKTVNVWYGFQWALRPIKAFINGKREPSKFKIILGCRKKSDSS